MDFHSSTAQVVKLNTSIPFITAFQLLEIHWRTSKLVERWSLRFLYQSLVRWSNSPCCYYMNTCLCGQKCDYTVINQSDSFRRNSADFKFVCMQVYQTLLLLRERGSGSETNVCGKLSTLPTVLCKTWYPTWDLYGHLVMVCFHGNLTLQEFDSWGHKILYRIAGNFQWFKFSHKWFTGL